MNPLQHSPIQQYVDPVPYRLNGHIRIFPKPTAKKPIVEPIFDEKNVIVTTVKSLFARLMKNSVEPQFGIWGLAVGLGDGLWQTAPLENASTSALIGPLANRPLSSANFVDISYNPLPAGQFYDPTDLSTVRVDFQTEITSPDDIPANSQIREMGLIGGGSTASATNMASVATPYWIPGATGNVLFPTAPSTNSVTLINYKTLPPLNLPPEVPFVFSWIIAFLFLIAVSIGSYCPTNPSNSNGHLQEKVSIDYHDRYSSSLFV